VREKREREKRESSTLHVPYTTVFFLVLLKKLGTKNLKYSTIKHDVGFMYNNILLFIMD